MNQTEQALHSWRSEKERYDKSIRAVLAELTAPIRFIPSPEYESKLQELKEYLRYSYTYDEEEIFLQIYVQHIAGVANLSLMELANRLVEEMGGTIKFWQNKVLDIAASVNYHSELSIWEVNRAYEKYMGLSPEVTNNLRKKKSLAKHYITALIAITRQIDKSKPFQEDLVKIDECFKRLKKAEEKYFAFMEEIDDKICKMAEASNVSAKGRQNAKNSLFMFLKPKQQTMNTLANYNFKSKKEVVSKPTQLLKDENYQNFDQVFENLSKQSRSIRMSNCDNSQSNINSAKSQIKGKRSIKELQNQFMSSLVTDKNIEKPQPVDQSVFIWSKEYYFSYWGFRIPYRSVDLTNPFQQYNFVNYEIDSTEQFDELNAEDLDANDENSSLSSDSNNNNSFVVSDNYHSEEDEKEVSVYLQQKNVYEKWIKNSTQLANCTMISMYGSLPLPLQEQQLAVSDEFMQSLNFKSRNQIFSQFESEMKDVPKQKIDGLLKAHFKKTKKDKKTIYVRSEPSSKQKSQDFRSQVLEVQSQGETTAQRYQITVSQPRKLNSSNYNDTIIEDSVEWKNSSQ